MASDRVEELKGAASSAARTLAAVDGRNWELLFFSTLDSVGSAVVSATVATSQPRMIAHRWRTVNRPRAANNWRSSRSSWGTHGEAHGQGPRSIRTVPLHRGARATGRRLDPSTGSLGLGPPDP